MKKTIFSLALIAPLAGCAALGLSSDEEGNVTTASGSVVPVAEVVGTAIATGSSGLEADEEGNVTTTGGTPVPVGEMVGGVIGGITGNPGLGLLAGGVAAAAIAGFMTRKKKKA